MSGKRAYLLLVVALFTGGLRADPSPQMAEYNRAWRLSGQGQLDEAAAMARSIISRDRTFWRAYHLLVDIALRQNRLNLAEKEFRAICDSDAGNAYCWYALGRAANARQAWEEAADYYVTCVDREPEALPCYKEYAVVIGGAGTGPSVPTAERAVAGLPARHSALLVPMVVAGIHTTRRELDLAERVAIKGLLSAQTAEGREVLAEYHQLLGGIYHQKNDFQAALSHARSALVYLEHIGDEEQALYVRSGLITCLRRLGELPEALATSEQILERLRADGLTTVLQRLLNNHAEILDDAGDLIKAIVFQQEAIESLRKSEMGFEGPGIHNYRLRQVRRYLALGLVTDAVYLGEQTLADVQSSRWASTDTLAFAHRTLSHAYRAAGDMLSALRHAGLSVRVFESLGMSWQAGAGLGNIGTFYGDLGDWDKALHYTRSSYESGVKHQDVGEQQRNLMVLGDLSFRAGRYPQSISYFKRALAMSETVRFPAFDVAALSGIGKVQIAIGNYADAEVHLNKALEAYRRMSVRAGEAQVLVALGYAALLRGRLAEAERHLHAGLEIAESLRLVEEIVAARRWLAEISVRRGRDTAALDHYGSAVQAMEVIRRRRPSTEQRITASGQTWQVYEEAIHLLWRLHEREPSAGYDRRAFELSELARARTLLDTLSHSGTHVHKGLSGEQVRRHGELFAELTQASENLLKRPSEARQRAYDQAQARVAAWVEELRAEGNDLAELLYPEPARLTDVQDQIGNKSTVVLEYLLGTRQSYLWVITSEKAQMHVLPPRSALEEAVLAYREHLSKPPRGVGAYDVWKQAATTLYHRLVEPAGAVLGESKHAVIVPDGVLHYLPFETLIRPDSSGTTRVLMEQITCHYAPSASVFVRLNASSAMTQNRSRLDLLAYGDPIFEQNDHPLDGGAPESVVRGIHAAAGMRFTRLPNSGREVELVGDLFRGDQRKLLLREKATEASVKGEDLNLFKRIHFATHAFIDERVPGRSGIVLSQLAAGGEDGILRLNEIFNLRVAADLVVLSACRTGLGKVVRGEGIVGLTRGFLHAGAPRVVVSLWDVNDLAASDLMVKFYSQMQSGLAPSSALRAAKLEMYHSRTRLHRHPYFWAAFTLVGAR